MSTSPSNASTKPDLVIGVLALQGAFLEHISTLERLNITAREVRSTEDLQHCDGLILPGGESTVMSRIAEREGLMPHLKQWVHTGRPVFGTCAGLILLSDAIHSASQCGQTLITGLHITANRNHYGTQSSSFQAQLDVPVFAQFDESTQLQLQQSSPVRSSTQSSAVFIRAPAIESIHEFKRTYQDSSDSSTEQNEVDDANRVHVLAVIPTEQLPAQSHASREAQEQSRAIEAHRATHQAPVAVRQGNILATCFHPELTRELRWHKLFHQMVQQYKLKQQKQQHQTQ